MNNNRSKIDIIRKLLDEIESEDQFTDVLDALSPNSQKDYENFSPERVYFELIKHIVDQDNLPKNVYGINVHMNNRNEMIGYELISFSVKTSNNKSYINIIWVEQNSHIRTTAESNRLATLGVLSLFTAQQILPKDLTIRLKRVTIQEKGSRNESPQITRIFQ